MTTRLAIRFGFIMQRIKERSRLVGKELFEEISPPCPAIRESVVNTLSHAWDLPKPQQ